MSIVILFDSSSMASDNIKDKLLTTLNENSQITKTELLFDNFPIYEYNNALFITTKNRSVYCENIDKQIETNLDISIDLLIFATTHRSKSGIPSLSAHSIGNWGKAELGGKDFLLCPTAESFVKTSLQFLEKEKSKYETIKTFDVVQEATHHGPEVLVPTMFIEIGSSPTEWNIKEAGILLGKTILYLIDNYNEIASKKIRTAFGIGGTHTCSNFHKIIMNDPDIALGHVCPKYMLDYLNEKEIKQAMEKTTNPCNEIILDWKGLGKNKDRIVELITSLNITFKKTKDFKYSIEQ